MPRSSMAIISFSLHVGGETNYDGVVNSMSLMLIRGGLKFDVPISYKSLHNPPMPLPINNEDDLEAFAELHRDVLGGCRLRLKAYGMNVFTDTHEGKKVPRPDVCIHPWHLRLVLRFPCLDLQRWVGSPKVLSFVSAKEHIGKPEILF
ncbi:hypothetical protein DVH24_015797 [Malus domestica]|uniref:Uncharacterized protein n=1 Tax=Malus domestica TaxID=3750 RepID=A0A498HNQ1_MALDO|nr:hypothetical protein DVH24_015797 [Malus domestica]